MKLESNEDSDDLHFATGALVLLLIPTICSFSGPSKSIPVLISIVFYVQFPINFNVYFINDIAAFLY